MKSQTLIVSRRGNADAAAAALEDAVADRFHQAGWDVLVVPHLYHVPEQSHLWPELSEKAACDVIVLSWLYSRPAEWLLRRHQVGADRIMALNLRDFADGESCFAAVQQATDGADRKLDSLPPGRISTLQETTATRWYPVVDGSRCINCQHCLQFCLFGVYALDDDGRLVVREPDRCKPGCPACSRICPQGAIMFPLYQKDAAIAGAPGLFLSPDLAARRMFYMRTKRPCPTCGRTQHAQNPMNVDPDSLCPECGGVRPQPAPAAPAPPAFDDLDALVDQLDQVMRRKS
jgi:Pyruvate/2-oxoacid:ferredoxin oxidoreductase delta subunit